MTTSRGYALLESLISGTVLTIMLTSIVGTLASAIDQTADLHHRNVASSLVRDHMEALILAHDPNDVTPEDYDVRGQPGTPVFFQVTHVIEPAAISTLRRVRAEVVWGAHHRLSVETLRD